MQKWQLEAVIEAQKIEIAKAAAVEQGLHILLDDQADEIDALHNEVGVYEALYQRDQMKSVEVETCAKVPERILVSTGTIALLCVAQMLEHRAEGMAIVRGADAGEYARLCEHAHTLRTIARQTGDYHIAGEESEATELFDLLASRF